ncbi:hypothetical protein ACSSZE_17790 [Acidithiobacillus caldus]|uniref:Uncharacterized protein n=1 Tax=Acidithiobacillus caldus TaxID=33059 RepID=A0A1E7YRM2_9PROT|nr:hypothetical protein BAE30_16565 [Acidithiobacillus caldus]
MTTIMKPQAAAHYLTRRAIRRYPSIPENDNETYLAMFTSVLNIMAGAAASGELKLIAWPLWWPIPASMAVDDDGRIVDGAGVTDTALYEWVKTFDPDVTANKQTVEDFWKELQGDKTSDEAETVMSGGMRIIGDFSSLAKGEKTKWRRENADRFIRIALENGVSSDRKSVTEWVCSNIPAAQGTNPVQWHHYMTRNDILRVREQMQRENVKN